LLRSEPEVVLTSTDTNAHHDISRECEQWTARSIPHYRGALAQSGELQQLRFSFNQMDRRLAFVAVTNKRCIAQRLQTFPALRAMTIQMALDRDIHRNAERADQRGTLAERQLRTRCTSYPDQRDWNVWCV